MKKNEVFVVTWRYCGEVTKTPIRAKDIDDAVERMRKTKWYKSYHDEAGFDIKQIELI